MRRTKTKPSGIEEAYAQHAGSLTRFLHRFLDSPEEIEDVLQDAFLKTYEAERQPVTADIVATNRQGGPERVIDVVTQRAPDGFDKLEDVASREELAAIVAGYSQLAGFTQKDVNR